MKKSKGFFDIKEQVIGISLCEQCAKTKAEENVAAEQDWVEKVSLDWRASGVAVVAITPYAEYSIESFVPDCSGNQCCDSLRHEISYKLPCLNVHFENETHLKRGDSSCQLCCQ